MYHLRLWLDKLRTSLWFVPSLIVIGSVVLANAMLYLDLHLPHNWWKGVNWLESMLDVRLAGATATLQAVGGSIITIAGVVFSITIAAMTLAAGQYTSRVLRNFIRDRANQAVLGIFLGIFVYCLLIMRSLSGISENSHAPPLAMLMTLVLAFVGVATLIFFIHHIARSLQATSIVASIAHSALPSIDRHFPERFEPTKEDDVDLTPPAGGHRTTVRSSRSGYVTGIDFDDLIKATDVCGGLVRVRRAPGFFVTEGEVIGELQSTDAIDDEMVDAIRSAWSFSAQRTLENDPGYGIRQLVDVALKALSPGVNETTTGVMCINWIGVILARMSGRRLPAQTLVSDKHVRVLTHAPRMDDFIKLGLDQIRQNAIGNVAVLKRMLEVLLVLADGPGARVSRQAILRQTEAIEAVLENTISWPPDCEPLRDLARSIRDALGVDDKARD